MAYCHKSVRDIARNMAGAAYEELSRHDQFYAVHPNQNMFIAKNWKRFVGYARQSLVTILASQQSDDIKADVMDILIKDRSLQDVQEGRPIHNSQGTA